MEAITWAKQPGDTWLKTQDNFPSGVRWAKIRYGSTLSAGSWRLTQAVSIVESAISTGKTGQHEEYTILPDKEHSEAMPEEVKQVLRAKAPSHFVQEVDKPCITGPFTAQVDKPGILCAHEGCENRFPRARGRFPQRFCPAHRN